MLSFVLRRCALAMPSLLGLLVVTFLLIHAVPNDPAAALAGDAATPAQMAKLRAEYGLDRPIVEQFVAYTGKGRPLRLRRERVLPPPRRPRHNGAAAGDADPHLHRPRPVRPARRAPGRDRRAAPQRMAGHRAADRLGGGRGNGGVLVRDHDAVAVRHAVGVAAAARGTGRHPRAAGADHRVPAVRLFAERPVRRVRRRAAASGPARRHAVAWRLGEHCPLHPRGRAGHVAERLRVLRAGDGLSPLAADLALRAAQLRHRHGHADRAAVRRPDRRRRGGRVDLRLAGESAATPCRRS